MEGLKWENRGVDVSRMLFIPGTWEDIALQRYLLQSYPTTVSRSGSRVATERSRGSFILVGRRLSRVVSVQLSRRVLYPSTVIWFRRTTVWNTSTILLLVVDYTYI